MKRARCTWSSVIGLGAVLGVVGVACAQRVTVVNGQKVWLDKTGLPLPEGMRDERWWESGDHRGGYSHWTAEAWTGSDAPFVRIKRNIDQQVKQGKKPLALLEAYRSAARKNPMDAQAQFRWAYAAFTAHQKWQKWQDANAILAGVVAALERPRSPQSYEYARMRTIFTQWNSEYRSRHTPYLRKAVLRLVKRNARDYSLKYIFAYDFALYNETNVLALQWANEYRRAFPNKAAGLYLLANVYEAQFNSSVSESKGRLAIEYFNKYLMAARPADAHRQAAQWHINDIGKWTNIFRRKGMLKA